MARVILYATLAGVGVVILVETGWVGALVYAFLIGCVLLVSGLIARADDTAQEHGVYTFWNRY